MTSSFSDNKADKACPDGQISKDLDIVNERGLHARASVKFVKCAGNFDAKITVSRDDQTVLATSIMGLMMLAAGIGTTITVCASGPEARDAIDALASLVSDKFGEQS